MEEKELTLHTIDELAEDIAKDIEAPILIMYYDLDKGIITDKDVKILYDTCRNGGATRQSPYKILYVLLHTYGGEPDASYRLAQVIHDFAEEVVFLVPYHALSGGTLICLGGNKLMMGAYATLSPIDVTVDNIELASIDQFRYFAVDTREEVEYMFKDLSNESNESFNTDVESTMMAKMIEQVTALDIGSLYRQSKLTTHYASKLMKDYMFKDLNDKEEIAKDIAEKLVRDYPAHTFALDYHMCKDLNLPVDEMPEIMSDKCKKLVDELDVMVDKNVICKNLPPDEEEESYKAPFFRLYRGRS